MIDFITALDRAKARFSVHPFWSGLTGTPLANDVPVIAAELMQEAAKEALQEAIAIAEQHADAYERTLAGGLSDSGLEMKKREALFLAGEIIRAIKQH